MVQINVVIGANYGDEGKGVMTDYLANEAYKKSQNAYVVRFNGGPQAGHTVKTPKGVRHVFHHFGSGALAGIPTILSKHFLSNPMFFIKEYKELDKLYAEKQIIIDPNGLVTTPFDMMLNETVESKRDISNKKHGSCGMGINETVVRSSIREFRVTVEDIRHPLVLQEKLKNIKENYVPKRMEELEIGPEHMPYLGYVGIYEKYIQDAEFMTNHAEFIPFNDEFIYHDSVDNLIFEGAQGLQLDQNSKNFPHVTRSNTGIDNVLEIIQPHFEISTFNVHYMSRIYCTKHGAGSFPHEIKNLSENGLLDVNDSTNIWNAYQGFIRYAHLEPSILIETINQDINKFRHLGFNKSSQVVFTCVDHLGKKGPSNLVKFWKNDKLYQSSVENFVKVVNNKIGNTTNCLIWNGPTRNDVIMIG